MPLLQPSFRGRLRLFFAVIVIIPMIAVGVVLFQVLDASEGFKLDSGLDQAQKTAKNLYTQEREDAMAALRPIADDEGLATAIENKQAAVVQDRLEALARQTGAQWIQIKVDGWGSFQTGKDNTIAAATADLLDANGSPK